MQRRAFLASGAAALAAPSLVRAQSAQELRFIPQSDLTIVDPVFSSVYVTRNHGYMVYDTLYGQDSDYQAQPQMAEGAVRDEGGREWRLGLRDGLMFHDGTPVLARDCVASIRRWAKRDAFGQTLMQITDELSAPDDKTIRFRLKTRFPLLTEALGKIGINMLPIMPERLANTDAFKQVTEVVGSGPFRFLADERVSGSRVAYAKFDGYRPRDSGTPDWTAGPKQVHFDRVTWNVIPDAATAAAAMQRNEADWWEQPVFDLLPLMQRERDLKTSLVEVTGNIGLLRMNQLFPPFNNPAIRRAVLAAMDQADFMQAVAGDDRSAWRDGIGYFAPGTPMASNAGLAALAGPHDAAAAKAAILQAGYAGEPVVVMAPGDYPRINALCLVAADLFKRCGLNVQLQETDWGSVIQRRASKAPVDRGGWSVFITTFTGADLSSPASNLALRGNGTAGWFGWPDDPAMESLRDQWLAATDLAAQRQIAAKIQVQAFNDVPFLPLGQFFQPTTQRRSLVDGLTGMPLFWNIRRV